MDITNELIRKVVKASKEYNASPIAMRRESGIVLSDLVEGLSDGQCVQMAKIVSRKL